MMYVLKFIHYLIVCAKQLC